MAGPNTRITNVPGFDLPTYDDIDIIYVGSTNNVDAITYSKGGSTVAVLVFSYIGGAPATNDARVGSITRTV